MARETGEHKGEGRDWRSMILTEPRKKMLRQMRDGSEWHALELAAATGIAYATVYQSLKKFEEVGWARSSLETREQHQAREKDPSNRNKGPRRTYWRLTGRGHQQARVI
jgi:DNA-binding MarR family transcriptional regulator